MNVCRCPACGSTKAHYDPQRSGSGKTFMSCPGCGNEGLLEAFEVSRDWLVKLELDEGASVPERLAPQSAAERAAAEAKLKWIVLAHDTYAREDREIGTFETRSEAEAKLRELSAQPDAEFMRIVRAEPIGTLP